MVTLREIIEKATTRLSNETDRQYEPDDYFGLAEELGVYDWITDDASEDPVIESVYLQVWFCTDTYVGFKVYFFNKEPLCVSRRDGRKMDEEFRFFSEDIALRCRNYLLGRTSNDKINLVEDSYLDQEFEETYKIEYAGQVMFKYALFENRPVEILKRASFRKSDPVFGNEKFYGVLVRDENNKEILTTVDNLSFRYNQEIEEKPLPVSNK